VREYPSQELLKMLLSYDPETGFFYWLNRSRKRGIGGRAGCRKKAHGDLWYRKIKIGGQRYAEHRLAVIYMTGVNPEQPIDHYNLDGTDNRWSNLRLVTPAENVRNQRLSRKNTSGACGVYRTKNNKWEASITYGGKRRSLGVFEDWFDAVCARKSADNQHGFSENHGARMVRAMPPQ
jgi:hypothetical protein